MQLDHLSYSSISTWLLCPRSWKYRYLEKIQVPTSPALVFGSAFHNCVEAYIETIPTDRVPLSEQWGIHWNQQLERNPDIKWGKDTQESCFNDGLRMFQSEDIKNTVDSIAGEPASTQVERKIELQVPNVPIPIIGYIDMIDANGIPHDFKTSARSWNSDKAQSEIQPLFYLAALLQAGEAKHQFRFKYVVFVKTKTPQVQLIESQHSIGSVFWLMGLIGEVWHAIEGGHYPPNPTGWKCCEAYCDYWSMCRGKV